MIDNRGEMSFMESMVAMMAVTIVIGLYLVFVSMSTISAYSPLDELDEDSLIVDTDHGPEISESYAYSFIFSKGLRGLSVTVTVPWFSEGQKTDFGDVTDTGYTKRSLTLIGYDNGRNLPTILEVVAFI